MNKKINQLSVLNFDFLILNSDDNSLEDKIGKPEAEILTFGFEEEADFRVTDVRENNDTNFKINHKGNIIPVWLKGLFSKEQIYSVLAASAVSEILGINLIKVSEIFKK